MKKVSFKQIPIFVLILLSLVVAGCKNPVTPDGKNQAPYNIVGPDAAQQVALPAGTVNEYTLVVDEVDGQKDPDGDDVTFQYELISQTGGSTSDVVASLNETTGVFSLTYTAAMEGNSVTIKFWTVDANEMKSDDYSIVFSYPENSPPVASFLDADYIVLGGGSSEINGLYKENGTTGNMLDGPKYEKISGSFYTIYQFANSVPSAAWTIHTSIVADYTDQATTFYYLESPASLPPISGWISGIGLDPVPEVHKYPLHVDNSTSDFVVSVYYDYSDPDDDQEGNTEFAWYSSADGSTGWTLEEDGTSSSFTTDTDLGFIKVIITPVDSFGLEGNTIESSPIDISET